MSPRKDVFKVFIGAGAPNFNPISARTGSLSIPHFDNAAAARGAADDLAGARPDLGDLTVSRVIQCLSLIQGSRTTANPMGVYVAGINETENAK
jgi:hypothetical protein